MKRLLLSTVVLAWVMVAISATTAVPALAQEAAPQAPGSAGVAMPNGEPPLPSPDEYVFHEDGTITVGGDAGTNCRDFARDFEQGNIRPGDEEEAQNVLAQCEQAGFLTPNGTAPVEAPTGQTQQYQQPATQAQYSGAAIAVSPGEDSPEIPYFAYNGDGTVTIDGDVGTSCYDFAQTEEGITRSGELETLAQSVLEQCEEAGALSPDNRYAAFPPDQMQQPTATQAEELDQGQRPSVTQAKELPATGGPSLSLAVLAAGASLVGLGGLTKLSRR